MRHLRTSRYTFSKRCNNIISQKRFPTGFRAGAGSVPYIYKRLQLQTDTDIYADDTITHTVGKKLEVVEPKLQNSADDCIDGASIIIWEFIMVKHMHS